MPIAMSRTFPGKKSFFAVLLPFIVLAFSAHGQNSLVGITIDAILTSSSELSTYRDVPINWKMKGRAQVLFNDGLNNLAEDNAALALKNFNDAIAADNTFWEGYYYRGIANRKLGNLVDAKNDYRSLVDGNKERYYSNIELGKIALLQRDIEESDRYFNKAIRSTDNNAYAQYLKANNQLLQRQNKAAINGYRECLRQDSSMHDAMVRLGMLSGMQNLSDVVPYLDKVLRRDSLNTNALLLRGVIRMPDNKSLAIHDFTNVLVRSPELLIGRYLRGVSYCDIGDFDRAFTDFHRVIVSAATNDNEYSGDQSWLDKKIDIQNVGAYTVSRVYGLMDTDGTALKKAFCLLVSGRYWASIEVIDALSIVDTEPLCLYLKALSMDHNKKHSKAFELYCKALLLDKEIVDAYKKRGFYYQKLSMWDKSIADFTTVLKLRPETLIAFKARGLSYFKTNRNAQALSDFNRYLAIDSTNQDILFHRGLIHLRQEDRLRSAADLANANRLDMIDIKKLFIHVDSTIRKGDTLMVVSALNTITKKAPWYTDIYVQKMRLLIALGKWEQIDDEIDQAVNSKAPDATAASYSYLVTVKAMTRNRAKKHDEAVALLSQAIDIDKKNALAFLERGKIHANAGRSGKAISDLNKAASLGDKDAGELLASVKAQQ